MIQHMSVLSNALCALEKNVFCRCWVDFSINTLEGKWVGSLVVAAGLSPRPISYGLCNPNCLSSFASFSLSSFQSSVIICTYIQDSMSPSSWDLTRWAWYCSFYMCLFGWRVCRVLQPVGEGQRTTWGAGSLSSTGESQRWSSGCQVWWQYLYPLRHHPSPAGFLTGVGLCSRRQMNCL